MREMNEYKELAPGFSGRFIGTLSMTYEDAVRQLQRGEVLYAVHDQRIRKAVVPLPDKAAWQHTDDQYGSGLSVSYFLAASTPASAIVILTD
jgi:hypothetical protein